MKQSCADKGVRHKNNQRKHTEQEQEDSENKRQYQINRLRLIQRHAVFTKRPVSLPKVYWWCFSCAELHVLPSHSRSTDSNGTMQGVSWHFIRLHQHRQPLHINYRDKTHREDVKRRRLHETLALPYASSGGDKRDERLPVMSLWENKLLLAADHSKIPERKLRIADMSHGHSWPVCSMYDCLTQKCMLVGTAAGV